VDLAAVVVALTCAANLFLGLFVLLRNPRAKVGRVFFALVFFISAWAVSNYFTDNASQLELNIFFNRFAYLFGFLAILTAGLFTHYFGASLQQKYPKTLIRVGMVAVALICVMSVTDYVAGSVTKTADGALHFSSGSLIMFYLVEILVILGIILRNMYLLIKKGNSLQKNQARILIAALAGSVILGTITNVIIPILTSNNFEAAKFGPPLLTLFFVSSCTYTIITRRLFDIRLVVARSVAYTLLLTFMGALYAFGIFALGGLFFKEDNRIGTQQLYDLGLALILALTFQPLKRFFEKITDSVFYRDHYDPQTVLSELSNVMAREIELVHLTDKVINVLLTQMKISKALIVVMDDDGIFYVANKESINFRSVGLDELKALGSGIIIKDAIEGKEVPEIFRKYGLSVTVGLHSTNELVGFLLLGEKLSGGVYNDSDLKTLRILAQELAIAIHNARSYTQIQDFNKTLQQRIEEATEQLRSANENLKKMDGVKNEFLSMATHQLNTPLSVVDGYLTMINDTAHGKLSDQQRDFSQKALHRVRLMKRLVTDFLNVSRLETGKFSIDAAPVDLNKIVSEEVNELGPTANEKEVLLQYMAPKHDVPVIEIDEQKTRQAIMNLIDNAIHYTPKGEVKVYLESNDKNVTFKVVDNGIGVPEDQKRKLFQKFSRGENAKKERPSGSGVGLYLVKKVIEDQGGSVIFESQEDKGSTFGFHLPIKTAASEQAEPELEPVTPEEKELEAVGAAQKPQEKEGSYYKIIG
jgi:signal transduction histidine kinase